MELLPLLRSFWRRRFVLVGAFLASVAAFVALSHRSPGVPTPVAWTQVTLDTPNSQLAAAAPAGAQTLPWRASLLMDSLATDASTRQLAQSLGVSQYELAVVDPSASLPVVQTSMAMASAKAASQVAPYTLEVFLPDPALPVISIEAAAPQPSAAERLARAAVAVLKSQASPGGRFNSLIPTDADPRNRILQPFAIEQVTPVRVTLFPASALSLKAIAAALFVFVLCVTGGRIASRVARRLRPRNGALADSPGTL